MRISFSDKNDGIWFEYSDGAPQKFLPIGSAGKINMTGFYLYAMCRNATYDSYKLKLDLAADILVFQKVFHEQEGSSLSVDPLYNDPLYHYSVAGCLDTTKTWLNSGENLKTYFSYQNVNGHKKIVGFVHFTEKLIDGNSVVYIAEAAVMNRANSVGRRLMECVLSHYPEGTNFRIVTRVFNTEAKTLYQNRLNFLPITEENVRQLGYDNRYCGFEHTTSCHEVAKIKAKQIKHTTDTQPASVATSAPNSTLFRKMHQSVEQHDTYCGFRPGFLLGRRF